MPPLKNKPSIMKTFRFDVDIVENLDRILYLTKGGDTPKYPTMTSMVMYALSEFIKKERRKLEKEGVMWEHIEHGFKQSLKEEI